jgi:hypothetical protein
MRAPALYTNPIFIAQIVRLIMENINNVLTLAAQ